MTPEQQRIAIARACGWNRKPTAFPKDAGCGCSGKKPEWNSAYQLPDYLNDLNAMHEAVETLFESSIYQDYWPMLDSIAQRDGNRGSSGRIAHTTAKQQAEAFLCVRNRDKS